MLINRAEGTEKLPFEPLSLILTRKRVAKDAQSDLVQGFAFLVKSSETVGLYWIRVFPDVMKKVLAQMPDGIGNTPYNKSSMFGLTH